MTSFQLPSTIFPENAITRAERRYQQRSAKKPRRWRRWLTRIVMWLGISIALIEFFGLLVASLTQRDPTPFVESIGPLPTLFIIVTLAYHLSLMFQTISLSAHSITREKESQTWEMLVLTGIDARQIVRGKWWAIVQRQVPRYAILAVLRGGMTAAVGIILSSAFSSFYLQYYGTQIRLAHPITILVIGLMGAGFTFANLGLSAACGIMASATSKRSSTAILRGFSNQIVISIGSSLAFLWFINRLYDFRIIRGGAEGYVAASGIALSLFDNGIMAGISAIGPSTSSYYEQLPPAPIKPIAFEWIISCLIAIAIYALLIRFVLWRAEKNAVRASATSFDKS